MRLATLFSGIGAPEQGARRVYGEDLELVFACEYDKFARQSFKAIYNIADEHFHNDVHDLDGTQYKGKVDVLAYGSPCQSFSIAGKRLGMNDSRGGLIYDAFRILSELMPEYFIYENVAGLLSIDGGKTIKNMLTEWDRVGYKITMNLVNTKDVRGDVPQNRVRLFVIGKKK